MIMLFSVKDNGVELLKSITIRMSTNNHQSEQSTGLSWQLLKKWLMPIMAKSGLKVY
jgi:hypothetical protein